jgi:hypothetical protein
LDEIKNQAPDFFEKELLPHYKSYLGWYLARVPARFGFAQRAKGTWLLNDLHWVWRSESKRPMC